MSRRLSGFAHARQSYPLWSIRGVHRFNKGRNKKRGSRPLPQMWLQSDRQHERRLPRVRDVKMIRAGAPSIAAAMGGVSMIPF